MDPFQGSLQQDGQVVVEGLEGRVTVEQAPNRPESWSGFFSVPPGGHVELEQQYDLILSDGRSCRIKIERVNATAQGETASFGAP